MAKFIVTATADFAGYTEGQKLSKPGDIAAYFRAMLNEGRTDGETTLTDAQIIATVMSISGDDGDTEVERVEALETLEQGDNSDDDADADGDADDDATDNNTALGEDNVPAERSSDVETEAKRSAEPFASDVEMQNHIRETIAAGRKVKMGPLVVMIDYRRVLPDVNQRLALPFPGTSWKERKPGDNTPVDKRRILVRGKNGLKPTTVSTYDLMFAAMPAGRELQTSIDLIDNRKVAGKANQYTGWKDHDADGERDTLVGDRTQGRTLLKRAVKLDRQLLACLPLDTEQGVKVSWKQDTKGVPANTRYGIVIKDNRDGTASRYSIDQFLGFNVAKALDPQAVANAGGIFEALVQSGGETGEPETPQIAAMDSDMFMAEAGMMASYLTIADNRAIVRKRFYADTDEGRAFMQSIVDFHDEVHEWCNDPVIRQRYAKVTGEVNKGKPAKAA